MTRYVSSAPGVRTYIAHLDGAVDLRSMETLRPGPQRKAAAVAALSAKHEASMGRVRPELDELRSRGILTGWGELPFGNMLIVDVPEARVAEAWGALNSIPGVGRLVRNREVRMALPIADAVKGTDLLGDVPGTSGVAWGVAKVGADKVWASGNTGAGVVIGIVDTGVAGDHPALRPHYRGTNEDGSVTDDYSYFDVYGESTTPTDEHGHGTHVAGIAVGGVDDEQIGMAPGAKWIAARMMGDKDAAGQPTATLDGIARSLEWMMAPTNSAGQNPDPTKAPDIVSHSWSIGEGSKAHYLRYWDAFNAAGIIVVAAAGNDGKGPKAGTVTAPGSYPNGITVGSSDKSDRMAWSSGRGPSPLPRTGGAPKPDVAAPGVGIRSSIRTGKYGSMSGTSMATPAVAGVIALMLGAHPDLTQAEVLQALQDTAVDIDEPGRDMASGAGRIDAERAVAAAAALVAGRGAGPAAQP